MTRNHPFGALISIIAAVVVISLLSGSAAAFSGDPTPVSPETGVDEVQPSGQDENLTTASRTTFGAPSSGQDDGSATGGASTYSTASTPSVLPLAQPDAGWPLVDAAGATMASPAGLADPGGSSVSVIDLPSPPATDTEQKSPGGAGDRVSDDQTPHSGGGPQGADGGVPVSVAVGGLALATVARRGAQVGGMTMTGPLGVHTRQGLLERIVRMFYPLRYSRYDDSDPLEHETRQRVHEIVESTPGTYLSAISEQAEVPLSTARHHVRVLEREGLVASAKVRGKRRFYPVGLEEVARAAAIDDGAASAVLQALARLGPCSVADLADELDRDSSTVTYHLQRLEEDDLVERERDGRAVQNRLVDPLRATLAPGDTETRAVEALVGPADD